MRSGEIRIESNVPGNALSHKMPSIPLKAASSSHFDGVDLGFQSVPQRK